MYHPTGRVLTILEMLQSKPDISGPELATILEVDVRTVRRYITILQDVGIPVEANIGRYGGYRLRPGFKLPPLMFTEEEATAIMLGLLGTAWLEIKQPALAVEGALAKISRVLPLKARERLKALSSYLVIFSEQAESRPDVSLLITISEAIGQQQRIDLHYVSGENSFSQRKIEPYGIVEWSGDWYLVAYCCLRQAMRGFRLDRIQKLQVLKEGFVRPPNFDCRAYIIENFAGDSYRWLVEVEFQAEMEQVQKKMSNIYGTLTANATGVSYQVETNNLENTARYLMSLALPFTIQQPPELKEAFRNLAAQMLQVAKD
jgi:predicted DNA-binding transcriptional regulator YafY